ncbi:MAG TPA: hypothetical protein VIK14_16170 [Ignavibacteria bacterium]
MAILLVQKRFIAVVFFLLLGAENNCNCYSQTIVNQENPNERIFRVRIKQFNEFIDRFNYKTNFNGDTVDSVFKLKIPRDRLINSLFDLKDPRIDPSNKKYSKKYRDEKKEFIDDVVQRNLLIHKYSDKIIAEAKSRIVYKGITNSISILLKQEIVGEDMVKWVITNVKGDIFDFLQTDTAFLRFIPPSSNETDFMNLKRALEDTNHLQYYASKNYDPDYLTLFFYMINSKLIKFEYVEEIIYHIVDVPGWYIKVKEFNRIEMNSGWLITDVGKNSPNKLDYLKTLNY